MSEHQAKIIRDGDTPNSAQLVAGMKRGDLEIVSQSTVFRGKVSGRCFKVTFPNPDPNLPAVIEEVPAFSIGA